MDDKRYYIDNEREIGEWIDNINALLQELSPNAKPISKEYLRESIKKGNLLIVRDVTGNKPCIVGMGYISFSCQPSGITAKIADVVVLPSHRRKGLGKRIVKTLVESAEELGAEYIELSDDINNPSFADAKRLCKRFGFKPIGNYMRYCFENEKTQESEKKQECAAGKNE